MKGDFYLGAWLVQPSLGRVSLDGRTVQVRPKVMDLLVYLAALTRQRDLEGDLAQRRLADRGDQRISPDTHHHECATPSADDADQPRFLETIPKRGYRLIAAVRPVVSPEESNPRGAAHPLWRSGLPHF